MDDFDPDKELSDFNPDAELGGGPAPTDGVPRTRLEHLGEAVQPWKHIYRDAKEGADTLYGKEKDEYYKALTEASWYDVRPQIKRQFDVLGGATKAALSPLTGLEQSVRHLGDAVLPPPTPEEAAELEAKGLPKPPGGGEALTNVLGVISPARTGAGWRSVGRPAPAPGQPPTPPSTTVSRPSEVIRSEGQRTRDLPAVQREQDALQGTMGAPAQERALEFFEKQQQPQIEEAVESVRRTLRETPQSPGLVSPREGAEDVVTALTRQHDARNTNIEQIGQTLDAAREYIRTQLSPTQSVLARDPNEAAQIVSQAVGAADEAAQAATNAAYTRFRELPGQYHPATFNRASAEIRQRLAAPEDPAQVTLINQQTTPTANAALKLLDEILGGIAQRKDPETGRVMKRPPVTPALVENARKRLSALRGQAIRAAQADGKWADANAMEKVIDEFDALVLRKSRTTFRGGDADEIMRALQEARNLYSQHRRTYHSRGSGDKVGPLMQQIIGRHEGQALTPEQLSKTLYGGNASVPLARRLNEIFGNAPEVMGALRQGLVSHIIEAPPGKTPYTPQQVAKRIEEFTRGSGRSLTEQYLTPDQIRQLRTFGEGQRRYGELLDARPDRVERDLRRMTGADGAPRASLEDTMTSLYGAILKSNENAPEMVRRLVSGPNPQLSPPQVASLREGTLRYAMQAVGKGDEAYSYKRIADNLHQLTNTEAGKALYTPQQRAMLTELEHLYRDLILPRDGKNWSGTAHALAPVVKMIGNRITQAIATAIAHMVGAGVGTSEVVGFGVSKVAERAAQIKQARDIAKQLPLIREQMRDYQKALRAYNKTQNPLTTKRLAGAATSLNAATSKIGIDLARIPALQLPGTGLAEDENSKVPGRAEGGSLTAPFDPDAELADQQPQQQSYLDTLRSGVDTVYRAMAPGLPLHFRAGLAPLGKSFQDAFAEGVSKSGGAGIKSYYEALSNEYLPEGAAYVNDAGEYLDAQGNVLHTQRRPNLLPVTRTEPGKGWFGSSYEGAMPAMADVWNTFGAPAKATSVAMAAAKAGTEGKLSSQAIEGVRRFIGDDPYSNSLSVNPKLREGEALDEPSSALVASVDEALKSAPPLQQDTFVYRATPKDWRGGVDPAFVSTTRSPEVAAEFAENIPGGGVVHKIKLPKGTQALETAPFQMEGMRYQDELLLPRGGRFEPREGYLEYYSDSGTEGRTAAQLAQLARERWGAAPEIIEGSGPAPKPLNTPEQVEAFRQASEGVPPQEEKAFGMKVRRLDTPEEKMRKGEQFELGDPNQLRIEKTRTLGDEPKDFFFVTRPTTDPNYVEMGLTHIREPVTGFSSRAEAEAFIRAAQNRQARPEDWEGPSLYSDSGSEGRAGSQVAQATRGAGPQLPPLAPEPQLPAVLESALADKPEISADVKNFLRAAQPLEQKYGKDWATQATPEELAPLKGAVKAVENYAPIFERVLKNNLSRRELFTGAARAASLLSTVGKLGKILDALPAPVAPIAQAAAPVVEAAPKALLLDYSFAIDSAKTWAKQQLMQQFAQSPKGKKALEKGRKAFMEAWDKERNSIDFQEKLAPFEDEYLQNTFGQSKQAVREAQELEIAEESVPTGTHGFADEYGNTYTYPKDLWEEIESGVDSETLDHYFSLSKTGKAAQKKYKYDDDAYVEAFDAWVETKEADEALEGHYRHNLKEAGLSPEAVDFFLKNRKKLKYWEQLLPKDASFKVKPPGEYETAWSVLDPYGNLADEYGTQAAAELNARLRQEALQRFIKRNITQKKLPTLYADSGSEGRVGSQLAQATRGPELQLPPVAPEPQLPAVIENALADKPQISEEVKNFLRAVKPLEEKYGADWAEKATPEDVAAIKADPALENAVKKVQQYAPTLDRLMGVETSRRALFRGAARAAAFASNASRLAQLLDKAKVLEGAPKPDVRPAIYQKLREAPDIYKERMREVEAPLYKKYLEVEKEWDRAKQAVYDHFQEKWAKSPVKNWDQEEKNAKLAEVAEHYEPLLQKAREEWNAGRRSVKEAFNKEFDADLEKLDLPKLSREQQVVLDYLVNRGSSFNDFQRNYITQNPYHIDPERFREFEAELKADPEFGQKFIDRRAEMGHPTALLYKMTPEEKAQIAEHLKPVLLQDRDLRLEDARMLAKAFPTLRGFALFSDAGAKGRLASQGAQFLREGTDVYHGTQKPTFERFYRTGEGSLEDSTIDRMLGTHVAPDAEISNTFVQRDGGVYPLRIPKDAQFLDVPQRERGFDQYDIERFVMAHAYKKDPAMLSRYLQQARVVPEQQADEFANALSRGEYVDWGEGLYNLERLIEDFGGRPYNKADRAAAVDVFRKDMQKAGYAGLRYRNTSPMETENARDLTSYIVFDPGKHLQNRLTGAFMTDSGAEGRAASQTAQALRPEGGKFYSAAERAVENSKTQKATPQQWLNWLKNQPGVTKEELEYLNLDDWAKKAPSGAITKDEFLNNVREGALELDEQVWGAQQVDEVKLQEELEKQVAEWKASLEEDYPQGPSPEALEEFRRLREEELRRYAYDYGLLAGEGRPPRYEQYTLPGGENYREIIATLPTKYKETLGERAQKLFPGTPYRELTGQQRAELARSFEADNTPSPNFSHSHWPGVENPLYHMRVKDREIPGVGKSFHLEELQSDWHQQGRKKGYQGQLELNWVLFDGGLEPHYTASLGEAGTVEIGQLPSGHWMAATPWGGRFRLRSRNEAEAYVRDRVGPNFGGVPDAPFKKNWAELGLRNALLKAVQGGYDAISWTPGLEQAKRYNLATHVERLEYNPKTNVLKAYPKARNTPITQHVPPERLPEVIGEEVTKKLLAQPIDKEPVLKEVPPEIQAIVDKLSPGQEGRHPWTMGVGVYEANVHTSGHPDNVTSRLTAEEGRKYVEWYRNNLPPPNLFTSARTSHVLNNADMMMGGEGMKAFYDKMLVNKANDLGKKFGAKVEWKPLEDGPTPWREFTETDWMSFAGAEEGSLIREVGGNIQILDPDRRTVWEISKQGEREFLYRPEEEVSTQIPVLKITPKLREHILEKGLPLFADSGTEGRAASQTAQALDDVLFSESGMKGRGASQAAQAMRPKTAEDYFRKIDALDAMARDRATTEAEKETARNLKARLEAKLEEEFPGAARPSSYDEEMPYTTTDAMNDPWVRWAMGMGEYLEKEKLWRTDKDAARKELDRLIRRRKDAARHHFSGDVESAQRLRDAQYEVDSFMRRYLPEDYAELEKKRNEASWKAYRKREAARYAREDAIKAENKQKGHLSYSQIKKESLPFAKKLKDVIRGVHSSGGYTFSQREDNFLTWLAEVKAPVVRHIVKNLTPTEKQQLVDLVERGAEQGSGRVFTRKQKDDLIKKIKSSPVGYKDDERLYQEAKRKPKRYYADSGAEGRAASQTAQALREPAPVFYSAAEKFLEGTDLRQASAQQWEGLLKNARGVKPDELKWTGIEDFLARKKAAGEKVTREELQDHLATNKVDVQEVERGGAGNMGDDEMEGRIDALVSAWRRGEIDLRVRRAGPGSFEIYDAANGDLTITYATTARRAEQRLNGIMNSVEDFEEGNLRGWAEDALQIKAEGPDFTRYGEYQTPGGKNYRELLLTLNTPESLEAKALKEAARRREVNDPKKFYSSHWDEPNVIAHTRFTTREVPRPYTKEEEAALEGRKAVYAKIEENQIEQVAVARKIQELSAPFQQEREKAIRESLRAGKIDRAEAVRQFETYEPAPGIEPLQEQLKKLQAQEDELRSKLPPEPKPNTNKTLFIEEIQSDWHQRGRKFGYHQEKDVQLDWKDNGEGTFSVTGPEGFRATVGERPSGRWAVTTPYTSKTLSSRELAEAYVNYLAHGDGYKIPDAPFKKTWPELVFKRLLRYAADNGFDAIAWVSGGANKTNPVVMGSWGDNAQRSNKGLKRFYDEEITNIAKKYAKQHGTEVEIQRLPESDVELGGVSGERAMTEVLGIPREEQRAYWENLTNDERDALREQLWNHRRQERSKFFYMPLPDSLKRQATEEGFALFAKGGEGKVTSHMTAAWNALSKKEQDEFRKASKKYFSRGKNTEKDAIRQYWEETHPDDPEGLGLTDKEIDMFIAYGDIPEGASSGYNQVRKSKAFTAALEKLPKLRGTVYRGLSLKPSQLEGLSRGKLIEVDRNTAATPSRSQARDFADDADEGDWDDLWGSSRSKKAAKTPVILQINGGQFPNFSASGHSSFAGEEVVVPIGTKLRVGRVKKERGATLITLNVVATPKKGESVRVLFGDPAAEGRVASQLAASQRENSKKENVGGPGGTQPDRNADEGQNRAAGGRVVAANIDHNPTEGQKEAGNYKKDKIHILGLQITIENAKGKPRSGIGHDGKRWSVTMPAHYGYVNGSVGADKDHVDVYVGPHTKAPNVYVIDQYDAETGAFDEHKCCVGFASEKQALDTYLKGFSDGKGPLRFKAMKRMTVDEFKRWVFSPKAKKPIAS